MRYRITISGVSPLITHNGAAGLDTRSPANIEKSQITKKRGTNRTESDEDRIRELDCLTSLYLDDSGAVTFPAAALRANIEGAARKFKQGPQVREGLIVEGVESFGYDRKALGTTADQVAKRAQFTAPVVVQRNRLLRTRAKFDSWSITFTVEVDDELVDQAQLLRWLDVGGRRLGLGDWRPEKSGSFGRYAIDDIEALD